MIGTVSIVIIIIIIIIVMFSRLLILSMLFSLDDEFGEDLGLSLDDVPGLVDFTLRHP